MFRDRTTRILLLILLVFMLVVSGVAVSGRMTHDPPNGLRCREYPFTPAGVVTALHADAFRLRVPPPPAGYQIDGFVGPVKWHGPPPGSALFEYYSRDCTRSIEVNEFAATNPDAEMLGSGAPERTIRLHHIAWHVWRHFTEVSGVYPDGVLVNLWAYRVGASTVRALLRNFPAPNGV